MLKKITSLILIIILALGAFQGCSSSEKNKEKKETKKETASYGGTLRLACVSVDTLNPVVTNHASVSDFLSLIYEGLFVLKADQTVEGVLAKDYTVSGNNTVYTIELKDNIRFHSGKIFTSEDVVLTSSSSGNNVP